MWLLREVCEMNTQSHRLNITSQKQTEASWTVCDPRPTKRHYANVHKPWPHMVTWTEMSKAFRDILRSLWIEFAASWITTPFWDWVIFDCIDLYRCITPDSSWPNSTHGIFALVIANIDINLSRQKMFLAFRANSVPRDIKSRDPWFNTHFESNRLSCVVRPPTDRPARVWPHSTVHSYA